MVIVLEKVPEYPEKYSHLASAHTHIGREAFRVQCPRKELRSCYTVFRWPQKSRLTPELTLKQKVL
jgi:hypothetical protein